MDALENAHAMLVEKPVEEPFGADGRIEQFRRLPASIALTPRLDGVKVCFVYLDRDSDRRFQGTKHAEFWVDLMRLAGADVGDRES